MTCLTVRHAFSSLAAALSSGCPTSTAPPPTLTAAMAVQTQTLRALPTAAPPSHASNALIGLETSLWAGHLPLSRWQWGTAPWVWHLWTPLLTLPAFARASMESLLALPRPMTCLAWPAHMPWVVVAQTALRRSLWHAVAVLALPSMQCRRRPTHRGVLLSRVLAALLVRRQRLYGCADLARAAMRRYCPGLERALILAPLAVLDGHSKLIVV